MEPITEDLSLLKQNMFFVEMENEICLPAEPLAVNLTILRHEPFQTGLLDSKLCQGIE